MRGLPCTWTVVESAIVHRKVVGLRRKLGGPHALARGAHRHIHAHLVVRPLLELHLFPRHDGAPMHDAQLAIHVMVGGKAGGEANDLALECVGCAWRHRHHRGFRIAQAFDLLQAKVHTLIAQHAQRGFERFAGRLAIGEQHHPPRFSTGKCEAQPAQCFAHAGGAAVFVIRRVLLPVFERLPQRLGRVVLSQRLAHGKQ